MKRSSGDLGGMMRRLPMDLDAYERRSRNGPCFICELLAGNPTYRHRVVWADEHAIAFLSRYPSLYGHTLVAPRRHREQVTGDFTLPEYLGLQRLVWRVGEALRQEVPTERLYVLSMGSEQGNRHVHWHVASLPPGVAYHEQQFAAFDPAKGIVALSADQEVALAERLAARLGGTRGQ